MEDVNTHITSTGNDQQRTHPANGQKYTSGRIQKTGNSVIRISLQKTSVWLTAAPDSKKVRASERKKRMGMNIGRKGCKTAFFNIHK